MAGGKGTEPRFFVDENDLALAEALALARRDVVYPGHRSLPEVPRRTPDVDWLPIVGERQLVVISRDSKIRSRPVELRALLQYGVRAFFLTGTASQDTWLSLSILVKRWDRIEEVIATAGPGPWVYSATNQTGLKKIELPDL